MTPDEYLDALHRSGWSVGVARFGATVVVDRTNGENVVRAAAATVVEAWRAAVEQAWALGMLRSRRTLSRHESAPLRPSPRSPIHW